MGGIVGTPAGVRSSFGAPLGTPGSAIGRRWGGGTPMMAMPHQAASMYAEPHGGGAYGVSTMHGLSHGHSGASAASFALNYQLMAPQVERTILTPGLGPIPPCTPNRTSWNESGLAPLPPSSVKAER